MNYQRIYDNLMKKRIENPPTGKFERHHIVPRSLGGSNADDNIVKLTYREHFIAHMLLCKIYKPKGGTEYMRMLFAFNNMRTSRDELKIKNSRVFEYFRDDFVKYVGDMNSKLQEGEGNSQYGTSWYYHPGLDMNAKFKPGDEIPEGFIKGRRKGATGGMKELRELGIIREKPQIKQMRRKIKRKTYTYKCIYCGEDFEAGEQAKGESCMSCMNKHLKLRPSSGIEGRDYLTDEQITELHGKFRESKLSVKNFALQCEYNVTADYLYSRWGKLGLKNTMYRD